VARSQPHLDDEQDDVQPNMQEAEEDDRKPVARSNNVYVPPENEHPDEDENGWFDDWFDQPDLNEVNRPQAWWFLHENPQDPENFEEPQVTTEEDLIEANRDITEWRSMMEVYQRGIQTIYTRIEQLPEANREEMRQFMWGRPQRIPPGWNLSVQHERERQQMILSMYEFERDRLTRRMAEERREEDQPQEENEHQENNNNNNDEFLVMFMSYKNSTDQARRDLRKIFRRTAIQRRNKVLNQARPNYGSVIVEHQATWYVMKKVSMIKKV
jgi:hypothetical protein